MVADALVTQGARASAAIDGIGLVIPEYIDFKTRRVKVSIRPENCIVKIINGKFTCDDIV